MYSHSWQTNRGHIQVAPLLICWQTLLIFVQMCWLQACFGLSMCWHPCQVLWKQMKKVIDAKVQGKMMCSQHVHYLHRAHTMLFCISGSTHMCRYDTCVHTSLILLSIGWHLDCYWIAIECGVPEIGTITFLLCTIYAMRVVSPLGMHNDCIAHDIICKMKCVVPEIGTMIVLLCILHAMNFVFALGMPNECIPHDMYANQMCCAWDRQDGIGTVHYICNKICFRIRCEQWLYCAWYMLIEMCCAWDRHDDMFLVHYICNEFFFPHYVCTMIVLRMI